MAESHEVEWQDAFSVGSELIDNQHKELVMMTNELFRNSESFSGVAAFLRTIQKAVNYAKIHFATEETFMEKTNYPEYELHKAEHKSFVAEVLTQIKAFEEGRCAPLSFALFLKKWLLNHIAVSDKKYSPYLKNIQDSEFAPDHD